MIKMKVMQRWTILFFILFVFMNCPKRALVKTDKIEVLYLSSLLDDLRRSQPYLCGVKDGRCIKIGYLNFENPFMHEIFNRLGFYRLLDEAALDFLITNHPVYGNRFLSIPVTLGYGFKNYQGIRFGVFCKGTDSLTISDQVRLATVKERSDVLWIVDKNLLNDPPMKINFIVRERMLQDTIIEKIDYRMDTVLFNKIQNFNQLLAKTLQTRVNLNKMTLIDFIFSTVKQKKGINVMLYPISMIKDNTPVDSITVGEFIDRVQCDIKFKVKELTKVELKKLLKEQIYVVLGAINKKNIALIPDKEGEILFDLLFY